MSDRDEREERAYADGYRIGRMHGTAVDPTVALEAHERLIAADVEIARLRAENRALDDAATTACDEVERLQQLSDARSRDVGRLDQERRHLRAENEQQRERIASLMLEEPSKSAGLYAAIDELQRADEVQDPSVDVANVNAAYVIERDDNARLRETLMRVNGLLSGGIDHHRSVGQACGVDACVLCLVEGIVREALNGGES